MRLQLVHRPALTICGRSYGDEIGVEVQAVALLGLLPS